ncbi:hypothetical protein [Streptomyces sp. TBY4]|uniref:hypothetical protein n=1 Tax=Streptomyces sp. TBY4 TaxID=2962030 RepID=UPI0020B8F1AA|nr:hypothetical protein [Streptomyces sp. TBY4]MCP3759169.1 hypothetical protein [Streptomyces sp. TBY4]
MTRSAGLPPHPEGQPDYVAEVATVPFVLGRPEELPTTPDGVRGAVAARAAEAARGLGPAARSDLRALLAAARQTYALLEPAGLGPVGDDPAESEANRDNDLAFGIVRTRGPVTTLLVDAALAAFIGLLEVAEERGSDLDATSWERILGGFDVLFDWFADPHSEPIPKAVPPVGQAAPAVPRDALRRWVRGHHVFMVFAQASALAMACLRDSADREDLPAAQAAAAAAVGLMRGCQGALIYAGDANREQYNEEIRPTLMPPVAPPKMSGLHWRDHEALIAEMARSTSAWQWLAGHRPELSAAFRAALDEAYASHMGVCEHFVGDAAPSLLAAQGSSRSAVGVIGQFRKIRLRSLPEPAATSQGDHS